MIPILSIKEIDLAAIDKPVYSYQQQSWPSLVYSHLDFLGGDAVFNALADLASL